MWKNEKFSPTGKIFREINSLATSLVKRYFHEIFSKKVWEKIIAISTLWDVSCNLCEKLMKNISWNQLLLSSITSWKTLISRKFWKIRFGKSKIAKCHKCILTYILYRHIHYSLIFIPSSPNSSFFPMRKKKEFSTVDTCRYIHLAKILCRKNKKRQLRNCFSSCFKSQEEIGTFVRYKYVNFESQSENGNYRNLPTAMLGFVSF